jgi:putative ABC transport system substrate-binding protein
MPVIGFLGSTSLQAYAARLRAFAQGLKEEGYIEGQNVAIEYRLAEDHGDRLPALAAELVHRPVTVIAAGGSPSSVAAKAATATIPIVFETASDPVALGLVASLNRPGGNLTGVTNLNVEVGQKRLELLRELLPAATNIAVLVDPSAPAITEQFIGALRAAAPPSECSSMFCTRALIASWIRSLQHCEPTRSSSAPIYSSVRAWNNLVHCRSATLCLRSTSIARSSRLAG